MDNILICYGTRPEWAKVKPLLKVLSNYKLLFTGQQTDLNENDSYDYRIKMRKHKNRLDSILINCLKYFPDGDFDSVLVQGDTASALGCALAAFHRNKKIYYLEAGLRSYNLGHPYPEEGYRQMISRIADINFCPTKLSRQNLIKEKVHGKCYVVGNTVLDNLVEYKEKCSYTNKVLVTLHRRENIPLLKKWFIVVNRIAIENPELDFILPIHPNPDIQKHKSLLTHVRVVKPLAHSDLLNLLAKCKLVISDSGGLQEEASFLNKKVIVCRETTERPEGLSTGHLHLCKNPLDLKEIFYNLRRDYEINEPCPYGDGYSAVKIAKILSKNEK